MKFKNPANDHTEEVLSSLYGLWVFLWAPIYYAVKGIWTHAVVSFLLCWVLGAYTFGIATIIIALIYAFMNRSIVRKHYLRKGWVEVLE